MRTKKLQLLTRFIGTWLILCLSLPISPAFDRCGQELAGGNGAASSSRSHALRETQEGLAESEEIFAALAGPSAKLRAGLEEKEIQRYLNEHPKDEGALLRSVLYELQLDKEVWETFLKSLEPKILSRAGRFPGRGKRKLDRRLLLLRQLPQEKTIAQMAQAIGAKEASLGVSLHEIFAILKEEPMVLDRVGLLLTRRERISGEGVWDKESRDAAVSLLQRIFKKRPHLQDEVERTFPVVRWPIRRLLGQPLEARRVPVEETWRRVAAYLAQRQSVYRGDFDQELPILLLHPALHPPYRTELSTRRKRWRGLTRIENGFWELFHDRAFLESSERMKRAVYPAAQATSVGTDRGLSFEEIQQRMEPLRKKVAGVPEESRINSIEKALRVLQGPSSENAGSSRRDEAALLLHDRWDHLKLPHLLFVAGVLAERQDALLAHFLLADLLSKRLSLVKQEGMFDQPDADLRSSLRNLLHRVALARRRVPEPSFTRNSLVLEINRLLQEILQSFDRHLARETRILLEESSEGTATLLAGLEESKMFKASLLNQARQAASGTRVAPLIEQAGRIIEQHPRMVTVAADGRIHLHAEAIAAYTWLFWAAEGTPHRPSRPRNPRSTLGPWRPIYHALIQRAVFRGWLEQQFARFPSGVVAQRAREVGMFPEQAIAFMARLIEDRHLGIEDRHDGDWLSKWYVRLDRPQRQQAKRFLWAFLRDSAIPESLRRAIGDAYHWRWHALDPQGVVVDPGGSLFNDTSAIVQEVARLPLPPVADVVQELVALEPYLSEFAPGTVVEISPQRLNPQGSGIIVGVQAKDRRTFSGFIPQPLASKRYRDDLPALLTLLQQDVSLHHVVVEHSTVAPMESGYLMVQLIFLIPDEPARRALPALQAMENHRVIRVAVMRADAHGLYGETVQEGLPIAVYVPRSTVSVTQEDDEWPGRTVLAGVYHKDFRKPDITVDFIEEVPADAPSAPAQLFRPDAVEADLLQWIETVQGILGDLPFRHPDWLVGPKRFQEILGEDAVAVVVKQQERRKGGPVSRARLEEDPMFDVRVEEQADQLRRKEAHKVAASLRAQDGALLKQVVEAASSLSSERWEAVLRGAKHAVAEQLSRRGVGVNAILAGLKSVLDLGLNELSPQETEGFVREHLADQFTAESTSPSTPSNKPLRAGLEERRAILVTPEAAAPTSVSDVQEEEARRTRDYSRMP